MPEIPDKQADDKIVRPPAFEAELPALPKQIKRPCDYGLDSAVVGLVTQLGTIEAYCRLVTAAAQLKGQIDRGEAVAANPFFLESLRGERLPKDYKLIPKIPGPQRP